MTLAYQRTRPKNMTGEYLRHRTRKGVEEWSAPMLGSAWHLCQCIAFIDWSVHLVCEYRQKRADQVAKRGGGRLFGYSCTRMIHRVAKMLAGGWRQVPERHHAQQVELLLLTRTRVVDCSVERRAERCVWPSMNQTMIRIERRKRSR